MNRFRMFPLAAALLVAMVVLTPSLVANAAQCDKGSCNARITTSIYTGQIQCIEDIQVKVVVAVCCPGACSSTQTFYKCGQSTDAIQFSACGVTHTITPVSNWEDALGDCDYVTYSAQ